MNGATRAVDIDRISPAQVGASYIASLYTTH